MPNKRMASARCARRLATAKRLCSRLIRGVRRMKQVGDPVTEDQLDRVQTTLWKMFLTKLAVAAAAGIAFSVVGILVGYILGSDLKSFSSVAILAGVIVAAVMALGHLKTYRSELRMVSELRKRLRKGELLSASSLSNAKHA